MITRKACIVFSALALTGASVFAQAPPPGYVPQPPGPPFYTYDAPEDYSGLITAPACTSVDGNIPAFALIPGGNIEGAVLGAQTAAANAGISPPCLVGSSFNITSVSAGVPGTSTDMGNTMSISTADNRTPTYSPAFGPNWAGVSGATYVQQFYAPPGAQINLSYTINGNGFVYIAVVSPCPDPPGNCVVGSTGAAPSYGDLLGSAPTANNVFLELPPFTVSSSGTYVVGIQVITGSQYPFPYYNPPYTLSVSWGCDSTGDQTAGLPPRQTSAVCCPAPTGEVLTALGWDSGFPTVFDFQQRIYGPPGTTVSWVAESNAQPADDTCWFQNSEVPPVTGVNLTKAGTYQEWQVNFDGSYGPDQVGFPDYGPPPEYTPRAGAVSFYRKANRVPCGYTVYQQMQFYCPLNNQWQNYGPVNFLGTWITQDQVSVHKQQVGGTTAGGTRRY
jgi:hypothetical protein